MKVSNFVSAGKISKKMDDAVVNIHCNPSGSIAKSSWDDYVQINIYSKEKEKFVRLQMTLDEAKSFQEMFNNGMKKFDK